MSKVKYINPLSPAALMDEVMQEQPKNFVMIYESSDGMVHLSCNYLDRIRTLGLVTEALCWLGSGEADQVMADSMPTPTDTD